MRKSLATGDLLLGVFCLVCASLALFWWIPLDTETGLIEKVRSQTSIGDALAPTVAACVLALAGALLCWRSSASDEALGLGATQAVFLSKLFLVVFLSLMLMRWAGPLMLLAVGRGMEDYPNLRDTFPWKYIGYLLGGFSLILGLIALVEHRLSWRAVWVALGTTVALIVIYDLPFDHLQLPPNGDF